MNCLQRHQHVVRLTPNKLTSTDMPDVCAMRGLMHRSKPPQLFDRLGYFANAMASSANMPPVIEIATNGAWARSSALEVMI
jgi:hypothetical protein